MIPHKLTAVTVERSQAMRVASALQDLLDPPPSALSVFEDRLGEAQIEWRIEAYFDEPTDAASLTEHVAGMLGESIPMFEAEEVPDLNWVAISQAALPPVFGRRFIVHGSHDRDRVPQGPNALTIEAGEAFGTAHHATTYGCLVALERLASRRSIAKVLDLGCGSGVLAIAAARLWPKASVSASDIDAQSIVVARENAAVNRVEARIKYAVCAGVDAPLLRAGGPYDLVVANILAEPLTMLSKDVRRAVSPQGVLILSGLLNHEADMVAAHYRAQGFAIASHFRNAGWSVLELVRRPPLARARSN